MATPVDGGSFRFTRIRGCRGLTVIEMLVASALFALAIGTVIGIFPIAAKANRQSHGALVAGTLAREEMELLRTAPFESIPASRERDVEVSVVVAGSPVELSYRIESRSVLKEPGLKGLEVVVEWTGPGEKQRRETFHSDVARYTP